MTSPVRAIWDAPAAFPAPPRRVWRDWALVAAIPALALLEAWLRPDVPWRWLWAIVLAGLAPTLLWRRHRPLTMLAAAFAIGTAVSLVLGGDPQLFTTAYFLILVYAVFRWGSGRAMLAGGALVAIGTLLTFVASTPTPGDVVGGIAVAVTTGTLGLALRWRARSRARELDRVRLLEREQLARDLHDTVAHHVSAIAIQAQAGATVAESDPDATAEVLRTIEGEASRTLREMRAMVGVLRTSEAADLAPTPGFAALRELERTDAPAVAVRITGDVDSVPPAVSAAVFRLAQEAVTNARRHAPGATRVDVEVAIDDAGVRVRVHDDGEAAASVGDGYGLTGMRERAALLGGTCDAGPDSDGGWTVAASLPRKRWTA
ncbi:sensor histidine kinase [Microbacterium sp. SS28]|uniref:sensor histidine kinase n=1 Tax=Microbacterium sp. SS28 TaxID=2919948 RepID=UPI001FAAC4AB|nr:sensor histidine kinase [Microbacterium sp. SS28]